MWIKNHLPKLRISTAFHKLFNSGMRHHAAFFWEKCVQRFSKRGIGTMVWSVAAVMAFIVFITVSMDITLTRMQGVFLKELRKNGPYDLAFDGISFVIPHKVILKNVIFYQRSPSLTNLARSREAVISFSIFDIVVNHRLSMAGLNLKGLTIMNYQYVYQRSDELKAFLKKFPRKNFEFKSSGTEVYLNPEATKALLKADFSFVLQDKYVDSRGKIIADKSIIPKGDQKLANLFEGKSLNYDFHGMFKNDSLSLGHLFVTLGPYQIRVWGNSDRQDFRRLLALYSLTDHPKNKKSFSGRFSNVLKSAGLWPSLKHKLDMMTDLDIGADRIDIKRMDFLYKGTPIYLSGHILLNEPYRYDLVSFVNIAQTDLNPLEFINSARMRINGKWQNGQLTNDGHLSLFLSSSKNKKVPFEKIDVDMTNMIAAWPRMDAVNFEIKKGELQLSTRKEAYRLAVTDVKGHVNRLGHLSRSAQFSALIYGGSLQGRFLMSAARNHPYIFLHTRFKHVDMRNFQNVMPDLVKVEGYLDGNVNFRNAPEQDLSGKIRVRGGKLNSIEGLDWLAKYFDIPSLKEVVLTRASSQFAVTPKGIDLKNVNLRSIDIDLAGDLSLSNDQLVKSQFSVRLTRELMQKSARFKPLLKMVEKDQGPFQFDFKLSGNLDSLNLQWTPSALKRKIQARIPGFIERDIENKIEASMDDISLRK